MTDARFLVRRPATGDFTAAGWRVSDPLLLRRQHDRFCELLAGLGCEVVIAEAADGLVDATYTRDPGLMTGSGAVLFQMAKPARQPEPPLLGDALASAGVAVRARLTGPARADGGDFTWLDDRTLLAGHSFRTSRAALAQLTDLLAGDDVTVHPFDIPYDRGPGYVTAGPAGNGDWPGQAPSGGRTWLTLVLSQPCQLSPRSGRPRSRTCSATGPRTTARCTGCSPAASPGWPTPAS
jgi:hypothetical protein